MGEMGEVIRKIKPFFVFPLIFTIYEIAFLYIHNSYSYPYV